MKKLFKLLISIICLCFIVQLMKPALTSAFMPSEYCQYATNIDAALIDTGAGFFYGIVVMTDGANPPTITVYANTAASGTKLMPTAVVPTSATDRWRIIPMPAPVPYSIGMYVDITISAGSMEYTTLYRER